MALLKGYIPLFREMLRIPSLFSGPILMFGYQDIVGDRLPKDFRYQGLKEMLEAQGKGPITTTDFFDSRADWQHDFNEPVPSVRQGRYQTLIDIGCLEHVFDTAQCIENCMALIAHDGWYVLVTPVNGCFGHGFHTFNPEMIREALRCNGFKIHFERYTSLFGVSLTDPTKARDVCMTIAAQKIIDVRPFRIPQQEHWAHFTMPKLGIRGYPRLIHYAERWTPPALLPLFRRFFFFHD